MIYLIVEPRSPDLAAHLFRSELFGREGFTIWNGQWYGGHHTPAYSILSPPLGHYLGPQLMGALSAVAATACTTAICRRHWGAQAARWGTLWFGFGFGLWLFTNRLPFMLGVAFAAGAVLALQRDRRLLAPLLAVLSAISSPVAGLFVAMGGTLRAGGARGGSADQARRRRRAGGRGPDPAGAAQRRLPGGRLRPVPRLGIRADTAVRAAVPDRAAAVRAHAAGGRGALRAGVDARPRGAHGDGRQRGPSRRVDRRADHRVRARGARGEAEARGAGGAGARRARVWHGPPAARDIYKAGTDPVAEASYFDPVREYFRLLPDQRRVEIPFTLGHWEGAEVASEAPMARGWLRQLDTGLHPIFYKGGLNQLTYASWLSENAVDTWRCPTPSPTAAPIARRR